MRRLEERGRRNIQQDMTNCEMAFLDTQGIVRPLSQTCDHMWRAQRTVRCCLYTPSVNCHCLDAKLPEKKHLRTAQDYKWSPDSGELGNN